MTQAKKGMSISVRERVTAFMRTTGMITVFGNPGSTELPLFRNWPDDFRYVLGLQESVVLSMADGYAQGTGHAAFVNLHSAAGLGHALGALFTAYKNGTPLVVTAGQQARAMLAGEPFLGAQSAAEFPRPYVKWACEPARAEDVPKAIARAYAIAMAAPRGPAFVSIPVDDWDRPAPPLEKREIHGTPAPSISALEDAARRIAAASSPVFVAGPEVDRSGGWRDVVALAERLDAPVWTSPMASRGCFPESHRLFAGFLPADRQGIAGCLGDADLLLVMGAPAFTHHVETEGPEVPPANLIQIVGDAGAASWTPKGMAVIGDVKTAAETLCKLVPQRKASNKPRRLPPPAAPRDRAISLPYLLDQLADQRPADSLIAEEAPSARPEIQRRLPVDRPASFFATSSGGLGFALPAAAGLALAHPLRRSIALVGDGSSLYAIQALWTAAQWQLPLTVIIVNNGGYEALKGLARHFQTKAVGADLPGLDFVRLAQGFGCAAARVDTAADLPDLLNRALSAEGPFLLDVVVNQDL